MRIYYIDASALVKHYLHEPGSHWVNESLKRAAQDRFVSTELIGVEVVCAIARAEREKRIGLALRNSLAARAIEETRSVLQLAETSRQILGLASQLALRHALRAYDAIHLATALRILSETLMLGLPAPIFVSADGNLLTAASAEGLVVENPNEHE
jgi:predicted nucleic acid-binding protein